MAADDEPLRRSLDEDAALRSILEGTATETGQHFFGALVDAWPGPSARRARG